MWHPINLNNYLLKFTTNLQSDYNIWLTDYIRIWNLTTKEDQIVDLFKLQNPLIDGTYNDIQILIADLLVNKKNNVDYNVTLLDTKITLTAKVSMKNLQISLLLQMELGSPEMLYNEFTVLLFGSMVSLVQNEKLMLKVINGKEKELEEFRSEGFEIKRDSLITRPFLYKNCSSISREQINKNVIRNPNQFWDVCIEKIIRETSEEIIDHESDLEKMEPPAVKTEGTSGTGLTTANITTILKNDESNDLQIKKIKTAKKRPGLKF